MEKKIWAILFVVVTLAIIGVFINSQGDPEIQVDEVGEEDIVWEVEASLFQAYGLFYEMEEELSDYQVEEYLEEYKDLEREFFRLEDQYFENRIDEEEFNREMEDLQEKIDNLVDDLNSLYENYDQEQ